MTLDINIIYIYIYPISYHGIPSHQYTTPTQAATDRCECNTNSRFKIQDSRILNLDANDDYF